MPNNNDVLDDLGFDLPPLPKIKREPDAEPYGAVPAEAPSPQTKPAPHRLDKNDILAAPDAPEDVLAGLPPLPGKKTAAISQDAALPKIKKADPLGDIPERTTEYSPAPNALEDDFLPKIKRSDPLADIPDSPPRQPAAEKAPDDDLIPHIKRDEPMPAPAAYTAAEEKPEDDYVPHIKRDDPLAASASAPPPKKKAPGQEVFVGSYEQKNKGNFTIGDDDDDDDSAYDSDLDHIDKSAIVLDDMDNSFKKKGSRAVKQQILMDEMSMDLEEMPVIEDLSNEYTDIKQKIKNDDFSTKDGKLEERERQAIKDHLKEEINKRPENFNKHASNAMAVHLQLEKNIKRAKKGFLYTVGVMFITLACAAVTYIGVGTSTLENAELFKYLSFGTVAFSLLLMIKSKHLKTLSAIYFILNTVVLAGPGLIMYVLNQQGDPDFNKQVIFFLIPAVLSGIAVFILCTNDTIDAYYTTDSNGKKRK